MFKIINQTTNSSFSAKPNQNILACAIENNINYIYGCTNGFCGKCKALIIKGKVVYNNAELSGLSTEDKKNGYALLCQCFAKSDIVLMTDELSQLIKVTTVSAKVTTLKKLNSDVMQVVLTTEQKLNFLSGQYVDIKYKDFIYRAFSIANQSGSKELEFHIRLIDDGQFTNFIFNHLKLNDKVKIQGPKGNFYLRKGKKDIILIAGGTGLAPIKAIIEELINIKDKRKIYLYWGVRDEIDLYSKLPKQWEKLTNITYIPVLSNSNNWQGRKGFVHNAVLEDIDNFANYCVYACGPPPMVEAVANNFIKHGMKSNNFFSDSFDFNKKKYG